MHGDHQQESDQQENRNQKDGHSQQEHRASHGKEEWLRVDQDTSHNQKSGKKGSCKDRHDEKEACSGSKKSDSCQENSRKNGTQKNGGQKSSAGDKGRKQAGHAQSWHQEGRVVRQQEKRQPRARRGAKDHAQPARPVAVPNRRRFLRNLRSRFSGVKTCAVGRAFGVLRAAPVRTACRPRSGHAAAALAGPRQRGRSGRPCRKRPRRSPAASRCQSSRSASGHRVRCQ